MKIRQSILTIAIITVMIFSCNPEKKKASMQSKPEMTAKDILGNPNYPAISFGGYRQGTRDIQPSVEELKEDLRMLSAMGIRILRTYNVQLPHAGNVLKAIKALKIEDQNFEMYVMLGAWIDCKNAWTGLPVDHNIESEANEAEIERAAALANQYPEIVKIIAVGNEAMVKWAESYYVQPGVILKWVNHLQSMKVAGELSKDLWITSSDDFSSWGGGDSTYHVEDLEKLIAAVDYVSMHTYPMHNTHYNPFFWGVTEEESTLPKEQQIDRAMQRALEFATNQYDSVKSYMKSLSIDKPLHIGETGWASHSNEHYGPTGSRATDEYKEARYYKLIREWSSKENVACFYFEAFNESWKDAQNPEGSENHFGLFTIDGKAKYALWGLVDNGTFDGLSRGGKKIEKTHNGDSSKVIDEAMIPPVNVDLQPVN